MKHRPHQGQCDCALTYFSLFFSRRPIGRWQSTQIVNVRSGGAIAAIRPR
ncbi:MAG: hypothetical protein HY471_03170 [Candidatus Sungbacteria bacterium]|nr:hypothetical protein [Candidatus Sungbacteria bacterium]